MDTGNTTNITDITELTIEECTKTARDIFDVFAAYYGEENVDIDTSAIRQFIEDRMNILCDADEVKESNIRPIKESVASMKFSITIHWPKITINNERGNHVDIYDLFCMVRIQLNGKLSDIRFTRSTFQIGQLCTGYIHSHLHRMFGIPDLISRRRYDEIVNHAKTWNNFCFGNGPIRYTISSLMTFDKDKDTAESYMLLCRELDICVRIESLAGVPYIKMSSISESSSVPYDFKDDAFAPDERIKDFARYYMSNVGVGYVFDGSNYDIDCSFEDFAIDVTRKYFEYLKKAQKYNTDNDINAMLCKVIKDCCGYKSERMDKMALSGLMEYLNTVKTTIIKFKNEEYPLNVILNDSENGTHCLYFVKDHIVSYIKRLIELAINSYAVINSHIIDKAENEGTEERQDTGQGEEGSCGNPCTEQIREDTANEKVYYRFIV